MVTKAWVESTAGDMAEVCIIKKSACENCDNCSVNGSCHAELLLCDNFKSCTCSVKNSVGAKKGDMVELYSSNRVSLTFAFIIFILPVVLTITLYYFFSSYFNERAKILISVIIFGILFFLCALISDALSKKYSFTSISKIIKENSEIL